MTTDWFTFREKVLKLDMVRQQHTSDEQRRVWPARRMEDQCSGRCMTIGYVGINVGWVRAPPYRGTCVRGLGRDKERLMCSKPATTQNAADELCRTHSFLISHFSPGTRLLQVASAIPGH